METHSGARKFAQSQAVNSVSASDVLTSQLCLPNCLQIINSAIGNSKHKQTSWRSKKGSEMLYVNPAAEKNSGVMSFERRNSESNLFYRFGMVTTIYSFSDLTWNHWQNSKEDCSICVWIFLWIDTCLWIAYMVDALGHAWEIPKGRGQSECYRHHHYNGWISPYMQLAICIYQAASAGHISKVQLLSERCPSAREREETSRWSLEKITLHTGWNSMNAKAWLLNHVMRDASQMPVYISSTACREKLCHFLILQTRER